MKYLFELFNITFIQQLWPPLKRGVSVGGELVPLRSRPPLNITKYLSVRNTARRPLYYKSKAGINRAYSTNTNTPVSEVTLLPVKIYENTDLDKLRILKENKAKAGVYR